MQDFAESVYTSGLAASGPEILLNMLDSIDTKAVHCSVSALYIALVTPREVNWTHHCSWPQGP